MNGAGPWEPGVRDSWGTEPGLEQGFVLSIDFVEMNPEGCEQLHEVGKKGSSGADWTSH